MKKYLFLSLLISFLFASCASMQEDIYVDPLAESSEISSFEERFSKIDGEYFSKSESIKDKNLRKECEQLEKEINATLANPSLKKALEARLYALAGCLAFDMGNKASAKNYYQSSVQAFKGDYRSLILARRLGLEKKFNEKSRLSSDNGILLLEEALASFSDCNYASALAKFDQAFLSLEPFYRQSYKDLREKSWKLRSSTKDKAAILSLQQISVLQMIKLTNGNPDLLFNYTLGKELSDKELYNKIAASGLLNPVSQELNGENALTREMLVTRIIAARFLWNLYNQRKNTPQNLTKYSSQFKGRKIRSPVLDVKKDSPDFDAVLGCVENEIMNLEDGIEFAAEKEISAHEFDESVKKIK
ncbi:MAG: hypothetical protein K5873_02855 [Treponema sp.]|nr:hypothetical protein [Treponema sp.]